jgi:predicted MFS family arabinose efflux permease
MALAGLGLLGVVFGIVRGQALGWTSPTILASLAAGAALLVAFAAWETRTEAPMLPLRFFRNRAFAATNGVSLAMFFGVFGSIFLLSQFFQTTQGLSPLQSGLRVLPWTIMPMFVAPVAGILSDRIGSRPLMAAGLALQAVAIAWLAAVSTPTVAYGALVVPFILAGTGMALVFAPAANAVLGAVRPEEAGQASGATNAIRELGGVLGVAVLASVFTSKGGYGSPQAYVDGMTAALPIGAAVLGAGALLALLIPGRRATADAEVVELDSSRALAEAA